VFTLTTTTTIAAATVVVVAATAMAAASATVMAMALRWQRLVVTRRCHDDADAGEDDAVVFFVVVVIDNDNDGDNADNGTDAREDDAIVFFVFVVIVVAAVILLWQPMPTKGRTKVTTPMPHATMQDGRGGEEERGNARAQNDKRWGVQGHPPKHNNQITMTRAAADMLAAIWQRR
jgi:hypothetical protein